MGWWACTIMGGDTPCDFICDLEDAACVTTDEFEFGEEPSRAVMRRAINRNYCEVVATAKRLADENDYDDYANIAYQVLGYFIITNGAKMTNEVRRLVLRACRDDAWSKDDSKDGRERAEFVKRFKRQIERYPRAGVARGRKVADEGLFQKFAEKMEAGEEGLINKNM